MVLNFPFFHLCLILFPLALALKSSNFITQAPSIIRPDCQSKCGNLTVPYPFGIGINSGCSISPLFDVTCNTTFNPPRPFSSGTNLEILEIRDDTLLIKNPIMANCINNLENIRRATFNLSTTPFTFSNANMLTVVGCDESVRWSENISFRSGCFALCSIIEDLVEGECSGIGCCRISIPKGLKSFMTSLGTLDQHAYVWQFNPCGYAFLGDPDSYSFSASDLNDTNFQSKITENVPVVLDWVIGESNCSEVQNNKDYACQQNSYCVDSGWVRGGYRCNCSEGYQGNPYISPGCTDVNECAGTPCHEHGICVNTVSKFKCSCRKGYSGDGTRDGIGCTAHNSRFP